MSGPRTSGERRAIVDANAIAALVEQRWAVRCGNLRPVGGGDESLAWRATTDGEPLLLHLSPPWRRIEELRWVHQIVSRLAERVPPAIAPLAATDGSTAVPVGGRLLSVYPFIEGTHLDREDATQRTAAARLLATIHRAQAALAFAARPPSAPNAPTNRPRTDDPAELVDRELDRWHDAVAAVRLPGGLVHGDFYRRNLLWANGQIAAVVDWHEARHDVIAREVAWSIWEFAKDDAGTALLPDRAREFLLAYEDAGHGLTAAERGALLPFIRWRLREELRQAHAAAARDEPWDEEYARAETEAFAVLRDASVGWR